MALLLGKCDLDIHVPSGSPRAKLDHLADELYERVVVCNLWDPPDRYMSNIMTNLETQGSLSPPLKAGGCRSWRYSGARV